MPFLAGDHGATFRQGTHVRTHGGTRGQPPLRPLILSLERLPVRSPGCEQLLKIQVQDPRDFGVRGASARPGWGGRVSIAGVRFDSLNNRVNPQLQERPLGALSLPPHPAPHPPPRHTPAPCPHDAVSLSPQSRCPCGEVPRGGGPQALGQRGGKDDRLCWTTGP